jgi:hypothetical protein
MPPPAVALLALAVVVVLPALLALIQLVVQTRLALVLVPWFVESVRLHRTLPLVGLKDVEKGQQQPFLALARPMSN